MVKVSFCYTLLCDPNDSWAHEIIFWTEFYSQTHFFIWFYKLVASAE